MLSVSGMVAICLTKHKRPAALLVLWLAMLAPYAYIGLTMAWRRLRGDAIIEPQMVTRHLPRTPDAEPPPEPVW